MELKIDKKQIDEAAQKAVEELKQNNIWIPKGMTNGEVIKALFPNADYESRANFMHITSANICGVTFFWDWWNSPYKAESEGKE